MRCWRLEAHGRRLVILAIDPQTREVIRETKLTLRTAMTKAEAQKYMDANFPQEWPACPASTQGS